MAATPRSVLANVNAAVTSDNAYVFGYGTATAVGTLYGGIENCGSASTIFSCGPGPETYTNIPTAGNTYLYLACYCDNSTTQGTLGQFTDGTHTVYTGVGPWEVYATGLALTPTCTATPATPTQAALNGYITTANSASGGAGTSVGWVTQAPTAGRVGVVASGEANDNLGGDFPQTCLTDISAAAHWMWYNPSPSTIADPFTSGAAGVRQLLIFRLPIAAITNPTAFYMNKDISNTSGVTANGVEMIIAGHHLYQDIFHATTPTFSYAASGANDKLDWSGGNIPNGSFVHVGIRTDASSIQIISVAMINNSLVQLGCARQLDTDIHTNASIKWKNDVTGCQSTSLFVGNISEEFYADEQPLSSLNGTTTRNPLSTVSVPFGPQSIAPGDSASLVLPAAPAAARWAVVHQKLGTTSGMTDSEDWFEVPVPVAPSVPMSGPAALVLLSLGLAAIGTLVGLKRAGRMS